MPFRFEVKVSEVAIGNLSAALQDAGPAWLETFGQYMLERTSQTFDALAHGGTFRGVTWPPFRRQPSQKRGGWSARLLDDTGTLKSSIRKIFGFEENKLILGADVPYAAWQQQMRPFLFFDDSEDLPTAASMAAEFIKKALVSEKSTGDQGAK